MTQKSSEITGITKMQALTLLFESYLKQRVQGEGPQSFQAWLEVEAPELWIKSMVWSILVKNRIDSLRKQIDHCQKSLDEHKYTSQTYPEIVRTKEDCNQILGELFSINGMMQHLKIE